MHRSAQQGGAEAYLLTGGRKSTVRLNQAEQAASLAARVWSSCSVWLNLTVDTQTAPDM